MKELTLGVDVNLDRVESLAHQALVGNFDYITLSHAKILSLIKVTWKPLVGYIAMMRILVHKWIHFHFLTKIDLDFILSKAWVLGKGSLWLQC